MCQDQAVYRFDEQRFLKVTGYFDADKNNDSKWIFLVPSLPLDSSYG